MKNNSKRIKKITIYLMAFSYMAVGITHFINPSFFMKIMPPYLPWHLELVYLSGFFEIVLGFLLIFIKTRRWAAWGLIGLLIAVFPANIYLAQSFEAQQALAISSTMAIARLPFQLLFLGIAYWLTRK
jgi:uncharacterized membrane protein